MKNKSVRSLLLFLFLLLVTPTVVLGQNTEELCRAFINRAFGDLGNNCANLASDEACYGFGNDGEVSSTFYVDGEAQVVQDGTFNEAADRVALLDEDASSTVESIETQAFALDTDGDGDDESQWGLAMLEVPANLPAQQSNNTAVYLLFGGARIENAVMPEDAVKRAEEPVSVTANDGASLYSSPEGLGYDVPSEVVGTSSGGLEADAVSPDGEWARVFFSYERRFGERTTAWVQVSDLADSEGLDALPVMGPESYTPMQSLFMSNDFSRPECSQVPAPGFLVQGPDAIETDFVLNNMPVTVTSTVYFRQLSSSRLQVFALSGITLLFPDSDNESILPEGFTQVLCLGAAASLGIDGEANDLAIDPNCPEGGPRQLTAEELADLFGFTLIPSNLLNYAIVLPSLVCPSGVGAPVCITLPVKAAARIRALCAAGIIPPAVCAKFGY
jgi:hypothetical protein